MDERSLLITSILESIKSKRAGIAIIKSAERPVFSAATARPALAHILHLIIQKQCFLVVVGRRSQNTCTDADMVSRSLTMSCRSLVPRMLRRVV